MNTVLAAGLSLEGQRYVKKQHCMQQYQFPAVLLQSTSVLSVVQGQCSTQLSLQGISLIPAPGTDPAAGFLRSPFGNCNALPIAQVGQGGKKVCRGMTWRSWRLCP